MRKFAFVLLMAVVMSISDFGQSAKNVEGAWQLTEITMSMGKSDMTMKVTQPSMYLFTKTHYSKMYVGSAKPRLVMDDYSKASREELMSIFVTDFEANAGSYEVKQGKLMLHPTVAKSPSDMKEGTWSSYSIEVSGNTITLTPEDSNNGQNKKKISFRLTRVE